MRIQPFVLALCAIGALAAPAAAQRKIVIDPGHGGQDPGGVGTGMQEKNVVLDTCKRFQALLQADSADNGGGGSWTVFMTRADDTFVELSARASYANSKGADRFMSVHSNAFGDASANGTETFSYTGTGEGAALRNLVQDEMIKAWGLTNRGNKTANFAVLRETSMPAELHELAFITNATDAQKLASEAERQKAAEAHLKAIQRHYDIPPYIPGGGGGETGQIAGSVVDDLGPVEGATVAVDSGQSVVTPADGSFTISDVPVGTRGLTVSAPGHEETVIQVEVSAGDQSDTEIHLDRSADGGGGGGGDAGIGVEPSADGDDINAGCGCRAGAGAGSAWSSLLALLAAAWLVRRRRGVVTGSPTSSHLGGGQRRTRL